MNKFPKIAKLIIYVLVAALLYLVYVGSTMETPSSMEINDRNAVYRGQNCQEVTIITVPIRESLSSNSLGNTRAFIVAPVGGCPYPILYCIYVSQGDSGGPSCVPIDSHRTE